MKGVRNILVETKPNPYLPPTTIELTAEHSPQGEDSLPARRTFRYYLITFGIVLSFVAFESIAFMLEVRRQFLGAAIIFCLAFMHIPLVHHHALWRTRFVVSLTIPFALTGAAASIGLLYLVAQNFLTHSESGLVPLCIGVAFIFGLVAGSIAGVKIVRCFIK